MTPVRNPLVWLWRIRHRRGYGIHSPFAYNLVTQVLYTPGVYYADSELVHVFSPWERLSEPRKVVCHRLLFRLANHWQPSRIEVPEGTPTMSLYLHRGCQRAEMAYGAPGRFVLQGEKGTMTVVYDLQRHKGTWLALKAAPSTRVTFDLYDVGIAVDSPGLQRQHYLINW